MYTRWNPQRKRTLQRTAPKPRLAPKTTVNRGTTKARQAPKARQAFVNGSRRLRSGAIQFKGKRGVWRPRKGCGCGR